jgi:hypothetical protein
MHILITFNTAQGGHCKTYLGESSSVILSITGSLKIPLEKPI